MEVLIGILLWSILGLVLIGSIVNIVKTAKKRKEAKEELKRLNEEQED